MVYIYASPEAVSLAWVASLAGIPAAGDRLPTDNSTWAASGYVVGVPAGGASNIYYPLHEPVATFQCWASNLNSGMPPWGKARNLVEVIRAETYRHVPRFLTLTPGSENARVLQTHFVGEPRKVYGDLGDYAAYSCDVQFHWVPVPKP
jgi:hypothetical protein